MYMNTDAYYTHHTQRYIVCMCDCVCVCVYHIYK